MGDVITWVHQMLANDSVAGAVGAALGVLVVLPSLDEPRWSARVGRRQVEHNALEKLKKDLYFKRPTGPDVYQFAPILALREEIKDRQVRMNKRAATAWSLPEDQYQLGCENALKWLSTVGALAQAVYGAKRPLRRFLQTYHLGIIREALIALPFVACLRATGALDRQEISEAAAGIALMELAAFYNSLARQQREPIYFKGDGQVPPMGPIVRAPSRLRRIMYSPLDRMLRSLPLRAKRVRAGRKLMDKIAASLPASERSVPGGTAVQ